MEEKNIRAFSPEEKESDSSKLNNESRPEDASGFFDTSDAFDASDTSDPFEPSDAFDASDALGLFDDPDAFDVFNTSDTSDTFDASDAPAGSSVSGFSKDTSAGPSVSGFSKDTPAGPSVSGFSKDAPGADADTATYAAPSQGSGNNADTAISAAPSQGSGKNADTAISAAAPRGSGGNALNAAAASGAEKGGSETRRTGEKPAPAPELENTLDHIRKGAKKTAGKKRAVSYQDKILRHKRRQYRRNVTVVIILTLLITAAVLLWMWRGYTRVELRRIAVLTAEDSSEYENLGGNVVQYSTDGALCIDRRGNTVWNVSYEMQQPVTSISGNVIAIADRTGYDIYIMDQKGLKGSIRTSLPIQSIAAGENGTVAVIMNDSKTTWVRLYAPDGTEIAYLTRSPSENGYPFAAAVSPDGKTMCLSSVQMSNAAVKTNVSFYNFGRAGRKSADHNVEQFDCINEVVPFLHYIDSSTCVCVSDEKLYCCWTTLLRTSGSSIVPLSDDIQGVFMSESYIGLLFTDPKGNTQYRLDLYNKRGKKAGSIGFSLPYTDISIAGDKVYINNDQQLQIYTIGGYCLYNGTFGRTIRALIPGASLSDLLVVTAEEVDRVRLH